MSQASTATLIKSALYNQGTTVKGWSEKHGFNYRTTVHAIKRHSTGTARQPWGALTRKILTQLEKDTGFKLLPN